MEASPERARIKRTSSSISAFSLFAVGLLHFVWATGRSWPLQDPGDLTGLPPDKAPGAGASIAVGGLLLFVAFLAVGFGQKNAVGRLLRDGASAVLVTRGVAGMIGQTERLVGWSTSDRFKALDRRYFGPFCLIVGLLMGLSRSSKPATRPISNQP